MRRLEKSRQKYKKIGQKLLTKQETCAILKMSKKLVPERSVWNECNGHDLQDH